MAVIPLELARELKEAGLVWQADLHDFFAIPDRDMDQRLFVLADVMTQLEILHGWPVVTFHGTAEWAADFIMTSEAIWVPTEEQLRQELERLLDQAGARHFQLTQQESGYVCQISPRGQARQFHASSAGEAYARALLAMLEYPTD